MAVKTGGDALDWGDRRTQGRDGWVGLLLCLGSAVVSLKVLGWAIVTTGGFIMR